MNIHNAKQAQKRNEQIKKRNEYLRKKEQEKKQKRIEANEAARKANEEYAKKLLQDAPEEIHEESESPQIIIKKTPIKKFSH
jgi:hypothetical protein